MHPIDKNILAALADIGDIGVSYTDLKRFVGASIPTLRIRITYLRGAGLVSQHVTDQGIASYRDIRITDAGRKALQENGQS